MSKSLIDGVSRSFAEFIRFQCSSTIVIQHFLGFNSRAIQGSSQQTQCITCLGYVAETDIYMHIAITMLFDLLCTKGCFASLMKTRYSKCSEDTKRVGMSSVPAISKRDCITSSNTFNQK
jgi:hypothetical protein